MTPLRFRTTVVPRWQQVYDRLLPLLHGAEEHRLTAAAAEAYLGYEAFDDPAYLKSRAAALEREANV